MLSAHQSRAHTFIVTVDAASLASDNPAVQAVIDGYRWAFDWKDEETTVRHDGVYWSRTVRPFQSMSLPPIDA